MATPRRRSPGALSRGRTALTATAGALLALALGSAAADRAGALPAEVRAQPAPAVDAFRLELIDQEMSFGADGTIRLDYRLTGDLGSIDVTEAPATTTTTTTTVTTDDTADPGDGTEGVPAEPPPVPLTLQVRNFPALRPASDPRRYVGPDPDPTLYEDVIDGVQYDLRPLLTVEDDGAATFTLDIPTDVVESQPDRLKFEERGVYPLRLDLLVGDLEAPAHHLTVGTVVQRRGGAGEEPIDLAAVAAIADPGPVADPGDVDAARDELDALVSASGRTDVPMALAIPPDILDAATATDDSDRIAEAFEDDELLALPAVPFDVSSAAAVGRDDAFAAELIDGVEQLSSDLPRTPVRRDVWLVTEPLSGAGAQALRELGVRLLVITDELYRATIDPDLPRTDLFVDVALPDGATMSMIVVDELGTEMTTADADQVLAERTGAEWAVGTVARLLLDVGAVQGEQRSRVIATPDLAAPDPRLLDALAAIVATTPDVRIARATELNGVTDTQRRGLEPFTVTLPDDAGPDLAPRLELLEAAGGAAFNAASMLPAGDPRPPAWAAELGALVSPAYPEDYVDAEVDEILDETEAITSSIVPPEPFTFTLTGREGDIDMRIGNTADEPLNVKLRMTSTKLTFPEGDQLVTLRANDETSVIVPVRARANGTSSVEVEILTPVDRPLVDPVTLTSRVTTLTGLGQVLTGGFILILLSWWFSSWRRQRRERLAAESATSE